MIQILKTLFDWPGGIVVGNLIASIMWATPALFHLHKKLNRHHKEMLERTKDNGTMVQSNNSDNGKQ